MRRKYAVTFIISIIVLLMLLSGMNLQDASNQSEALKILSNAFAVVGVAIFCFGIILWVDNLDGFQGMKLISFGVKKFFHYTLPFVFTKKLEDTFYDYYSNRYTDRVPIGYMLTIGGGYLLFSGVFAIIFEYV